MTLKEIINRISYFRIKENLSARELSFKIGKHEGYINKLESHEFNLNTKSLLEILDALNITAEEFFCLGTDCTDDGRVFLKKFNKLTKENKKLITDLMNYLNHTKN